MSRPHVVVIGAGFGGMAAARQLAGKPVDVTIVDRHNFNSFQPLLYQVATSGLNAADVAYNIRGAFQRDPNVHVRRATVTAVDWDRRTAHLDDGGDLPFDHLIVATGSTTNYFGLPGAEACAFPLYSLADAIRLRNHVLGCFEAAAADPSLVDRGILTFVVVGGGPTGVEVSGALSELFDAVLRKDFHSLDVGRARVVLVEMLDHLLSPFSETSQHHAYTALRDRGVELRLGQVVERIEADHVVLKSGETIATHTLIWAAGVRANPLADVLDVPQGRGGRIEVGADLQIVGRPGAYAIGDVADIADWRGGGKLPQLAPVAMQTGTHAARQILRRLEGQPTQAFRYRDKGTMATIGRRAAVAELRGGIKLQGFVAWVAWLGLHLIQLMGQRNRVSVFVNWAWNYLTWDRGPRLIIEREDSS
jgi:NADH dehydrogenase